MKRIVACFGWLAFLLAACSPAVAGPGPDPTQVEATSVAQANIILSRTPPPSRPPRPTLAAPLAGLPTDSVDPTPIFTSVGTATSLAADCTHPLDVTAFGPTVPVLIKNNTRVSITVVMGLGARNSAGQCGYLSWNNIAAGEALTASVPEIDPTLGDPCYWINAWIRDLSHIASISDGGFCINGPHRWIINVNYNRIRLTTS